MSFNASLKKDFIGSHVLIKVYLVLLERFEENRDLVLELISFCWTRCQDESGDAQLQPNKQLILHAVIDNKHTREVGLQFSTPLQCWVVRIEYAYERALDRVYICQGIYFLRSDFLYIETTTYSMHTFFKICNV